METYPVILSKNNHVYVIRRANSNCSLEQSTKTESACLKNQKFSIIVILFLLDEYKKTRLLRLISTRCIKYWCVLLGCIHTLWVSDKFHSFCFICFVYPKLKKRTFCAAKDQSHMCSPLNLAGLWKTWEELGRKKRYRFSHLLFDWHLWSGHFHNKMPPCSRLKCMRVVLVILVWK